MLNIVQTIFDIVFPPRPHEILIRDISLEILKGLTKPRAFEEITYLLSYQLPVVTALITENKYHHNELAAKKLSSVLEQWLDSQSSDLLVVPIPLSAARKKSRGYNQVEEIIKKLSPPWRQKIAIDLISRPKHTVAQTTLQRTERLHNMVGAFEVNQNITLTTKPILLIDDVTTTGATLKSARQAILAHEPKAQVMLLALAH